MTASRGSRGRLTHRSHAHSSIYTRRFADGRQRDQGWRLAHGLVTGATLINEHPEPQRSALAQVRYDVKHNPSIGRRVARAMLLRDRAKRP